MIDYDYEFEQFQQEVALMAEGASVSQWEAFFSIYAEVASENGDCGDLVYQPVRRDGAGGYQVDGYLIDTDRNELHLAICDYRPNENLEVMNAAEMDSTLRRVTRFCEAAVNPNRMRELEEASPEWEVVSVIQQYRAQFSRIRIVLLTNARLATRRKVIVSQQIIGADATFNVVDFNRYVDIMEAQGGIEDVELNLRRFGARDFHVCPPILSKAISKVIWS